MLGGLAGVTSGWRCSGSESIPFIWLLTQDSKARHSPGCCSRCVPGMPANQSSQKGLGFTVADPMAVARAPGLVCPS